MKKLGLFVLAMALLVTLSQCKKDNTTTPANDGEKVLITLKVSSNGAKHEVTPSTGKVTFENGDVLHVASNGVYLGALEYQNSVFSGEINTPTEGLPLHFYFLGNVTPEFNSDNTECSVVISDQTTNLPVISYNTSKENYETGKTDYNARLMNQCALVKFNVTTPSNSPICITGMHNKVTVDFANNTLTPSQDGEGIIMLPAGSGENVEKWAILLPQEALTEGEEGSAYSEDGIYIGIRPAITTIVDNGYLTQGISVEVSVPIGAINSLFSVSATKQVYFSQGNLQYQASTNTWRFAENQWDYVGNDNINISSTYDGWIDLFGWGTSGYNHGANCYQPWSTSLTNSNYYAYGYYFYNLNDQNHKADWGYNPITNGNNINNQWHTLTQPEWDYVFNTRNTTSNIRYAKANVNGKNGVILLPDNWDSGTYNLSNTNSSSATFSSNTISASLWITLESAGAVFLPAAGYRIGASMYVVGSCGCYWSASRNADDSAYLLDFNNGMYLLTSNSSSRCYGSSVRLVKDYNP